jgi:hypothetical protein
MTVPLTLFSFKVSKTSINILIGLNQLAICFTQGSVFIQIFFSLVGNAFMCLSLNNVVQTWLIFCTRLVLSEALYPLQIVPSL